MVSRIIELEQRQAGEEDRTTRFVESARGTWTVVRRHRVILFVTMALCVLAGVIYILLSTPDYRATASVEVEDVPAGAAGAGAMQKPVSAADTESMMQTELEVLRSRALAEDVARDLALVGSPVFFQGMDARRPAQGQGSLTQRQVEHEQVIKLLRDNLQVELPGKSRVLRISFVSADPALSARVANSYADSLIRADLKRRGVMIGANDLFIAAHARALGLTLVTNNTAEFERVRDSKLENWTLPARRSR